MKNFILRLKNAHLPVVIYHDTILILGKNGTRFALITFSSKPNVTFNLNDKSARSKQAVKTLIDNIQVRFIWEINYDFACFVVN